MAHRRVARTLAVVMAAALATSLFGCHLRGAEKESFETAIPAALVESDLQPLGDRLTITVAGPHLVAIHTEQHALLTRVRPPWAAGT